uniref:trypsin-like serine peptidase n=1 Tax=Persicitalea sp. TaxID=3100273 RepID=UPI0035937348
PDFELWEESGGIVEITDRCLLHPFTTTKRNSGSPVWTMVHGQPRVVGIHVSGNAASCGALPENRPFGSAVLIDERVFGMIEAWVTVEKSALDNSAPSGMSDRRKGAKNHSGETPRVFAAPTY